MTAQVSRTSQVTLPWFIVACCSSAARQLQQKQRELQDEQFAEFFEQDVQARKQLSQIGFFFQEVVCELVARDFRMLLERFLRKSRKSLTRQQLHAM